jgi:hypothetical protein
MRYLVPYLLLKQVYSVKLAFSKDAASALLTWGSQ